MACTDTPAHPPPAQASPTTAKHTPLHSQTKCNIAPPDRPAATVPAKKHQGRTLPALKTAWHNENTTPNLPGFDINHG